MKTRSLLRVVSDGANHRVEMPDGTVLPGLRAVRVRPLLPSQWAVVELEALVELDVHAQLPGGEGQTGSETDPEQKPWRQCLTPENKSEG